MKTLILFLKRNIVLLMLAIISAAIFLSQKTAPKGTTGLHQDQEKAVSSSPTIAISQILEHKALNQVRSGILKAFSDAGYREGENLNVSLDVAQGNAQFASNIAHKIVSSSPKPDVIFAISTLSAETLKAAMKHDPELRLVFAAVSDPVEAKLLKNAEAPEGNVTGVMDQQPLEQQLDLILKVIPHAKRIGVIYNPGETNSTSMVKAIKEINQHKGLFTSIEERAVMKTTDINVTLLGLKNKVDAIFIPLDNTMANGIDIISKSSKDLKLPVFSSDPILVESGVLASIGVSYEEIGRLAGQMGLKIFQGTPVGELPVEVPQSPHLRINLKTADSIGISVPSALQDQAAQLIR